MGDARMHRLYGGATEIMEFVGRSLGFRASAQAHG